jgi:poly-gamma-glutamate capsule biosynthesis protein CapA/YwtB (metallophosphatase superfamily)
VGGLRRGGAATAALALLLGSLAACSDDTDAPAGAAPTSAPAAAPTSPTGATPATTTPPTTTPPTTTRPLRRLSIAASGDILLHNPVIQSGARLAGGVGYDFDPLFDDVRSTLSAADLAICHQETPISADNSRLTVPGTLSFNAPREIATALKNAGFDGCDTASNHMVDRGVTGIAQTLDVLAAAGLANAGMSRDESDAATPPIHDVAGVRVGHLAFSYTIVNAGGPNEIVPQDAPWLASVLWPRVGAEGVLAQARALRARGAEVVVVSMHWGAQYVHEPTAEQRTLAQALLAAPEIDLVLGTHAHVVQPCEKIAGKYVVYGMGNFLSNQSPTQAASLRPDNQDGVIVQVDLEERTPGVFVTTRLRFTPTWVVIPGHRIERATPDLHPASFERTVANFLADGPERCDAAPA